MATQNKGGSRRSSNTGRKSKSTFVTKSGQTIKINRSIAARIQATRAARAQKRAERLAGMPKGRVQRMLFRLQPKRLYQYWVSREGGIMALKIVGIGTLAGFLLLLGVFAYFRKDLPNIRNIAGTNIGGSILYYDRTGQTLLFEDVDGSKRIPVQDNQISPYIKQATIAIEDKDFFKHGGFDVRGILRAGVADLVGHGGTQGGSTITQQLVRLTQPEVGHERTITRKVKEVILSVEMEREFSKQEILTGYLNAAPYGGIENGVEAAANDYFHKSAKDLTLPEAAMLAAIPKSPTFYSPYNTTDFDKDNLIGRADYILDQMYAQGMISKQQRDDAKKVDVLAEVQPRPEHYNNIKAPWFVLTAKEQLERQFTADTVKRGGWKVITTLDLNAQSQAEQQVTKGLPQVRRQGGDTAAFVAEDVKTGQVVALVGGADFNDLDHGKFNYARAQLSPGSSFKPYDYSALIDSQKNVGAGSVLYDSSGPIDGYPCTTSGKTGNCAHDYDFRFPGPVTLRYALGGSRNVPAMKAMLIAGVNTTISTAQKMMTNYGSDGQPDQTRGTYKCYQPGVVISEATAAEEAPCYTSSAIGDGAYLHLDEHVHGYGTLAREGNNIPQTYILKVTDAANKNLYEWKPTKGVQVIKQDTAYIIDDMISDPNASYFPGGNKPQRYKGWKFGVKTGTTNDSKDGLMMMISTQYAAGVWVGYHNRQHAMSGFMEVMTQPIVDGWMEAMHASLKPVDFARPSDIQTLPAFVVRNHVGEGSVEPSPSTDIFPSWYKQPGRASGTNQNVDKVSNKLATECTPPLAIQQVNNADSNTFSVDKFVKNGGVNTSDKDDVHNCSDAKPSVSLDNKNFACSSSCHVSAYVTAGTHPLSDSARPQFPGTINFLIDGQIVSTQGVSGSGDYGFNYTPTESGTQSLSVQVIDSVLYEGDDSTSITATTGGGGGGGGGITFQNLTPFNGASVQHRNQATFSWSSEGAGVTYVLNWSCNGQVGSKNVGSSLSYTPTSLVDQNLLYAGSAYPNVTCTWYVDASDAQSTHPNFYTFTLIHA